ncbi:adenine nucleotide alpha hydrolase [Acinetobacter junii]|uniref:adenine nucleotide alpha hydrolase n=1 Tax=Acinetobacter junii TaxID=40215 RepID=UPI0022EA66C7|nr:adenine nucleotide alpha hydrolase [Acinetobacter junii]MDA3507991.1 adenine nucleotide alpha hydrolase [Acinetobacter junii]MDA3532368.1 adenine nucleotide alpha hydrolase [Acinetobacter junii]
MIVQTPKKAVFNWSGGKDSALALYTVLQQKQFEVVALLTTVNEETELSSMHAIPFSLLMKQAESIGIPLYPVFLPKNLPVYEQRMLDAAHHFKAQGVEHFIFGDIYLSDVRKYREDRLHPLGIEVVEPIWNLDSTEVMQNFLDSGIRTKIIVTDASKLDRSFIGQDIDAALIERMPEDVDICGENGEYHTFAYAGALFKQTVEFEIVETRQMSYDFKLENGEEKTYHYWQVIFAE